MAADAAVDEAAAPTHAVSAFVPIFKPASRRPTPHHYAVRLDVSQQQQ